MVPTLSSARERDARTFLQFSNWSFGIQINKVALDVKRISDRIYNTNKLGCVPPERQFLFPQRTHDAILLSSLSLSSSTVEEY